MREASPAPDYVELIIEHSLTCTHYPAKPISAISQFKSRSHCDLRPVLAFRAVVLHRKRWAAIGES